MAARTPSTAALLVLLSLTLVACEGPTGPEGPAGKSGPGTRMVFSGTLDTTTLPDSGAVILGLASLPPEAGIIDDPPAATCWISNDGGLWLEDACVFSESVDRMFLIVGLIVFKEEHGWQCRIVIVY